MAANKVVATIKVCSFLAFLAAFMATDSQGFHLKETKMSVFMHEFFGGPNATDVIVAGIPGKEWGFFKFGTVSVADDLITQGIQIHSKAIARAQGTNTICSLDGINAQAQVSILFNNEKYKGSTLQLQGVYNQLATVTEFTIVSGTGKFRFARGFLIMETVYTDPSIFYVIFRCNITVQHY